VKPTDVKITHPFPQIVLTMRVTRGFWVRLWIAQRLIELGAWVGGGGVEWIEGDTE